MYSIAQNIISLFRSPQDVADICGVTLSTVHRWKYPKERNGQDGLIPAQYQPVLMKGAPEHGVTLKPEHFFEDFWTRPKRAKRCNNASLVVRQDKKSQAPKKIRNP